MDENIEIRSRKIRNIIGAVPSWIERCGITVIAIIVAGLLAAASLVPYPETDESTAVVEGDDTIKLLVPYRYAGSIRTGMAVSIEFEGYKAADYSYVRGTVKGTDMAVKSLNGSNYFTANINITDAKYTMKKGMKGTASILINNRSVLEHVFGLGMRD